MSFKTGDRVFAWNKDNEAIYVGLFLGHLKDSKYSYIVLTDIRAIVEERLHSGESCFCQGFECCELEYPEEE